ncbi:uncharacterized protein EI90DRAFT_3160468 [Cantharellus anzutake]|uniref:uncharacterized protein n=1 Tax=Cantharellus anzutake TaxID=1750568 RepID=UPI001907DE83|nr:uncharacterized protein EI90DRAFT_3160468 [Cantharellus anzutake]KAF8311533.1 hypothetical protein EI90DRAFT_3160468 [Cantharellus anzutake]
MSLLLSRFEALPTALAYLHLKSVVHGDVSPENVVMHDNVPKLCGFGLSALLNDETTCAQGSSMATILRYCAPELFRISRDKFGPLDTRRPFEDTQGKVLFHKSSDMQFYHKIGKVPPYDWSPQSDGVEVFTVHQTMLSSFPRRPSNSVICLASLRSGQVHYPPEYLGRAPCVIARRPKRPRQHNVSFVYWGEVISSDRGLDTPPLKLNP